MTATRRALKLCHYLSQRSSVTQLLSNSIAALSDECRNNALTVPSEEGAAEYAGAVNGLCDALDNLAEEALSRHVYLSEFTELLNELVELSAGPSHALLAAVQSAFAEQGPPDEPPR
jgi:hypothetical protein